MVIQYPVHWHHESFPTFNVLFGEINASLETKPRKANKWLVQPRWMLSLASECYLLKWSCQHLQKLGHSRCQFLKQTMNIVGFYCCTMEMSGFVRGKKTKLTCWTERWHHYRSTNGIGSIFFHVGTWTPPLFTLNTRFNYWTAYPLQNTWVDFSWEIGESYNWNSLEFPFKSRDHYSYLPVQGHCSRSLSNTEEGCYTHDCCQLSADQN